SLLPISPALSALLDTLLARFDAAVDWANPTASALPAETAAFHTRASEALALLRRELGPAFHIEDDRIAE
ncbi:MAG TPA: hypothetical protein VE913_13995, partial [Longimicrobium sp.]|nr:hypothetical protein [Longimicrobium sp.]